MKIYRIHALVCSGAQCIAANGNGFEDALKEELKNMTSLKKLILLKQDVWGLVS